MESAERVGSSPGEQDRVERPLRVLLVDDEPDVLVFLAESVRQAGDHAATASTAEQALGSLTQQPVDVVISDIRLPGLSGLELLEAVARRWPDVRVVLLTGAPSIESASVGIRGHAFDYLTKPVSMADIAGVLDRARRDRASADGTARRDGLSGQGSAENFLQLGRLALDGTDPTAFFEQILRHSRESLSSDAALLVLRGPDGTFTSRTSGRGPVLDALPILLRPALPALLAREDHVALAIGRAGDPVTGIAVMVAWGGASMILAVGRDAQQGGFLPDERAFLCGYARTAMLAWERLWLGQAAEQFLVDTVGTFVRALQAKDTALHGHGARVSIYAGDIAQRLGLRSLQLALTRRAGLLHDLGKLTVPDALLHKPGPLTPPEYRLVRQHPAAAEAILRPFQLLAAEATIIRHHTERHDGQGYPDQRSGSAIPLPSRIVAVADAFDAMTSARPYRPPRPLPVASEEIRRHAGTQFDPTVVDAFVAIPAGRLAEVSAYYRTESPERA